MLVNNISRRSVTKLIGSTLAGTLLCPSFILNDSTKMISRKIPSTGEELPVIGLGTWQTFDVGRAESERAPLKEVLQTLLKYGGSVIDSSPMYGRSERVVGELKNELSIGDRCFDATKVWTSGKLAGKTQIESSMEKMQAFPMDLHQVHNLSDWKTQLATLHKYKEERKIRYVGITHYHEGAYADMEFVMKTEDIDFIQINFNLAVREASKRLLPLAKDKGIAVIINRPYEGGSLFSKVKNQQMPAWASEFDADSWGQFFLKFILSYDAVNCVIPGTSKQRHMKDNAQAGFGRFPSLKHQTKMIRLIESL